jgi:hypothetical protein
MADEVESIFYNAHYEENVRDLFESSNAIALAENREFAEKWSNVTVTVPANYIDYVTLYSELERDYPHLAGTQDRPLVKTEELAQMLGEIVDPFVDYINLMRRTSLLQALNAYIKTGYLSYGLGEGGGLEYTLDQELDIPEDMRQDIIERVYAYARFS